jgi:signal transduction histidine kinase
MTSDDTGGDAANPALPGPQSSDPSCSADDLSRLAQIQQRLLKKLGDYQVYNFNTEQSYALNIFFDLAQEFTDVEDFYAVCVLIPKTLFGLDCNIYVLHGAEGELMRRSSSCLPTEITSTRDAFFPTEPVHHDGRYYLPIKGNSELISQLPFSPPGGNIGILEIFPADDLEDHDKLFFSRYANRIGYQLHNRFISQKNLEHISFIQSLVSDIGHNVIVPNMYFKLFYRRLEARIKLLKGVQTEIAGQIEACQGACVEAIPGLERIAKETAYIFNALMEQYKEIESHYMNTSLFLETLLRRSHFEAGRYVLEKRLCNFKSQIIDPQVQRFRPRFEERGIEIDTTLGGVPDREIEAVADIGLISQVYANFFSNAVKYAQQVVDESGRPRKFLSYGWEVIKEYFGPGRDGLKFNVFNTGPPIPPEEAAKLFAEGFRGSNAKGEYGTGHGLYFIGEVVKMHGGVAGYEQTAIGNNFYFILPRDNTPVDLSETGRG